MTTAIHPGALKHHRNKKNWTQEQLAEATKGKNKVGPATIKRIESTKTGTYSAQDRIAEALAKALGVSVGDLSKPPTDDAEREASLKQHGYRPLRTMLDAETALAFNMVQQVYGIPIRSQILMAPLFTALLAEGSLAWRRERVSEIEAATATLMSLGEGHFSFAKSAERSKEGARLERACIEQRDLFGKDIWEAVYDLGYDPSANNPFADYLKHFAKKAGASTVSFKGDWSSAGWKTSEGLPAYRIGADLISNATGDDPDAEYALLRGYVRLKDIPAELLGADQEDARIAWIISRIPEEEVARRKAEWESLLSEFSDVDQSEVGASASETKENDRA
jgi:transcriptional regulator with XRE-family HTH domain